MGKRGIRQVAWTTFNRTSRVPRQKANNNLIRRDHCGEIAGKKYKFKQQAHTLLESNKTSAL